MANCQLARWSEAVIRDQTGYGFYSCRLAGPRGRLLALIDAAGEVLEEGLLAQLGEAAGLH